MRDFLWLHLMKFPRLLGDEEYIPQGRGLSETVIKTPPFIKEGFGEDLVPSPLRRGLGRGLLNLYPLT